MGSGIRYHGESHMFVIKAHPCYLLEGRKGSHKFWEAGCIRLGFSYGQELAQYAGSATVLEKVRMFFKLVLKRILTD